MWLTCTHRQTERERDVMERDIISLFCLYCSVTAPGVCSAGEQQGVSSHEGFIMICTNEYNNCTSADCEWTVSIDQPLPPIKRLLKWLIRSWLMGHPEASVVTAGIRAYHALICAHTGTHLPLFTQALEAVILRISFWDDKIYCSDSLNLTLPLV